MASHEVERDDIDSLPPSCQYVLDALEKAGDELTRQELLNQIYLAERTTDAALDTLEYCDYISKTRKSSDLRQVVVKLAEERAYNTPESDRYE